MGNLIPCYGFVRTVFGDPTPSRPQAYYAYDTGQGTPEYVVGGYPSPTLRHRCRRRVLHIGVIVFSILSIILDIAGRVTCPTDPVSNMMPAICIAVPACLAASLGICSVSRYTTPHRRKCLFQFQYILSICSSIIIIGFGIYMATEFQEYNAQLLLTTTPDPTVYRSRPLPAPICGSVAEFLRTTLIIRSLELAVLLVLLALCILSACVTGRELCPECGCDCDCDDDPPRPPVIPSQGSVRQPVPPIFHPQTHPENPFPESTPNPYFYDYQGRPFADTSPSAHRTSVPEQTPLEHLKAAATGFWNRSPSNTSQRPAPMAPPPPSYVDATKE